MHYGTLLILASLLYAVPGLTHIDSSSRLDNQLIPARTTSASAEQYKDLIYKGTKALQTGYSYRALKLFQEAESIALKPTHAFILGVTYFRLKSYDTAMDYFNYTLESLQQSKQHPHKLLAQVYYYQGLIYKHKTNLISALLAMQKARTHVFVSKEIAFINGHLYAIEEAIKKDFLNYPKSIKLAENTEENLVN